MLRRILGGVAVALGTAIPASAQIPGYTPGHVSAEGPTTGRNATLGKPILQPSTMPAYKELMPSSGDLGTGPDGFTHRSRVNTELCDECVVCGPPGRIWGGFEYLYWVTSGQSLPTLVTSAPPGTPQSIAGAGNQPSTTTLLGGERVNNEWRNGIRAFGGLWLDPAQTCGIELDFLYLERSRTPFGIGSDGSSIIARPIFNAQTGVPASEFISFPGVVGGSVNVDATSRVIGGGINILQNIVCDPCGRTDLILGYRYFNVNDTVTVTENLVTLADSAVPAGTVIGLRDSFKTSNNFHGVVLGAATERAYGSLFFALRASVALGDNYQITNIDGATTITTPGGARATLPGGLLAQSTNIGRYTSNNFAVLPEIGLKLGVQLTRNARVWAGYNFLYLSNVARAGDQMDLRVNPSLLAPSSALVGPAVPAYQRRDTDFWMQGVTFGAELRF